jgi:transcriptional regulator with XRE-family HTH domain
VRYLTAWRLSAGLTLEELSTRLQVSHSTVQRWEAGLTPPNANQIEALAAIYGVEPAELMIPPSLAPLVRDATQILSEMSETTRGIWLATGAAMARGDAQQ